MISRKRANVKYPVQELVAERWSPRAFSEKPVEKEKIRSLLEAARWSPSAGNQQPWRFFIGFHGDETWMKIFESLDDGNKIWVKPVPVLILAIGEKNYTRKGKQISNSYYAYDTGQAAAWLTTEAASHGLHVHQMGGFNPETVAGLFAIPGDFQPLTVIALGYLADPSVLPEDLKERELAPRNRKNFGELVFSGKFGQKSNLFYEDES
jgi:nitroreductase